MISSADSLALAVYEQMCSSSAARIDKTGVICGRALFSYPSVRRNATPQMSNSVLQNFPLDSLPFCLMLNFVLTYLAIGLTSILIWKEP